MQNIDQLINVQREALIIFPNSLSTVTLVRIKADQWKPFQDFIEGISDDQIMDIAGPLTQQAIDDGIAKLGRKERREGEYVDWDEKMRKYGLP